MHKNGRFGYYESNQVQVLQMYYKGDGAFMTVILPKKRFSLDNLLKSIDGKQIRDWLRNPMQLRNQKIIDVCVC